MIVVVVMMVMVVVDICGRIVVYVHKNDRSEAQI